MVLASMLGGNAPDAGLLRAVNRFARHTPWLHGPARLYADSGLAVFAALLLVGWWWSRAGSDGQCAAALWAGATGLVALAVNAPLVAAFDEARPYAADPTLVVLAHRTTDPSFPSDHAVVVGAVTAALWFVDRRLGRSATVAAVVMAVARVYIAAHYPHDVVSDLLLGAAVGAGGWRLVRRPLSAVVARLRRSPLRALVAAG